MNVWIITVGESLPIDNGNARLWRSGTLAQLLAEQGHHVTLWTSTFFHAQKAQRFVRDTSVEIRSGYVLNLIHAPRYTSNVSVSRLINHYILAKKFRAWADELPRPDLILSSFPTIELSLAATRYGEAKAVPVVLDIRDLWPDIFLDVVPEWGKLLGRIALVPYFRAANRAFKDATAIIGITPEFVDWALSRAGRMRTPLDSDFPFGYMTEEPTLQAKEEAFRFWKSHGIEHARHGLVCCFFGALGRQFDLETVIRAARRLFLQHIPIRFVLCGDGDNLGFYRAMAHDCPNVCFPGWVAAPEIWTLMRMSSVGLAPYRLKKNFTMNLTNKFVEYISAGLPVLCSIEGVLSNLLQQHRCGFTYQESDHEQLANLLAQLCERPDILQELSRNACELFRSRFTAEKTYADMIRHLELVRLHCDVGRET